MCSQLKHGEVPILLFPARSIFMPKTSSRHGNASTCGRQTVSHVSHETTKKNNVSHSVNRGSCIMFIPWTILKPAWFNMFPYVFHVFPFIIVFPSANPQVRICPFFPARRPWPHWWISSHQVDAVATCAAVAMIDDIDGLKKKSTDRLNGTFTGKQKSAFQVGGIPTLWKIWKSVGMMAFPIYGKIKFMFQTTNQI